MPNENDLVPNLDFLRACAVLYVLADHILQAVGIHRILGADINWLGRTGVLFFFVHTCCVLMMSLQRHRGEGLLQAFYIRRMFRIYPLSMVGVLAVMMLPGAPLLGVGGWLSNLLLIQNLTFKDNAFGSIWSLPLEAQMYVLLPFIHMLLVRVKTIWPILLLLAASVPVALWQPAHIARAGVLAFAPAFLPGVLAYWLFRKDVARLPAWGVPLVIAGVTAAVMLHPGWTFPAWTACLALALLLPLFRQISSPALNRISSEVAKYSYGVYISHSILLAWKLPNWQTLPFFLLLVAAISVICYRLIEHPMMELGRRLSAYLRQSQTEPLAGALLKLESNP